VFVCVSVCVCVCVSVCVCVCVHVGECVNAYCVYVYEFHFCAVRLFAKPVCTAACRRPQYFRPRPWRQPSSRRCAHTRTTVRRSVDPRPPRPGALTRSGVDCRAALLRAQAHLFDLLGDNSIEFLGVLMENAGALRRLNGDAVKAAGRMLRAAEASAGGGGGCAAVARCPPPRTHALN
jgi:hypothetical protein